MRHIPIVITVLLRVHYGAHPKVRPSHGDFPLLLALAMSTNFNLQEVDPPVTVPIFISNGTLAHFPIFADQSRKEYLKCDLCGRELRLKNRKNTQGFVSHWECKGCRKGNQREEIYQTGAVRNLPASGRQSTS